MGYEDSRWPRSSGVLLHPSSLPGGSLGPDAFAFVDFLAAAGQSLWQILPLGPPGAGHSPYAAQSAFAGNPALIAWEGLAEQGLLPPAGENVGRRDTANQEKMLRTAFGEFLRMDRGHELERFTSDHGWAHLYASFVALRRTFRSPWWEWPEDAASAEIEQDRQFELFCQYQFNEQWQRLRAHTNGRGIRIMGDIPIFVDLNSCDAWVHRELFKLRPDGRPDVVAGVPPDAFSETGQRWGNPVYDWDQHRQTSFDWWAKRLSRTLELVDAVRLDHFRGFVAAWEIPADAETATSGDWVPGPGEEFFRRIEAAIGRQPIAVEDLGVITLDVRELQRELGYPGMAVLQFAFGDRERTWLNPHLPHRFDRHLVAYTGTHDNNTTAGWWADADDFVRDNVRTYLGHEPEDPARALIRLVQGSIADTAIVPLQDWLSLSGSGRMNTPGIAEGNWGWSFSWSDIPEGLAGEMQTMAALYGRLPGDQ